MKKNVSLVVSLVFSALVIGGALSYKLAAPTQAPIVIAALSQEQRDSLRANVADTANIDSDHDGLKDWEEALRGTDVKNPDTDGDKTRDGDEVAANRDPLKAGPDDVLARSESTDPGDYRAPSNLTRTQALGRELFAAYADLGNAGAFGTAQEEQVLNEIIDRNVALSVENAYTLKDLTEVSQDAAALAKYRTSMQAELKRGEAVKEYELLTLARFLDSNDAQSKTTLERNATLYTSIAASMIKIPVPKLMAATHLAIVNSLVEIAQAQTLALASRGDPASLLIAVGRFSEAEKRLGEAMEDYRTLTK